MLKPELRLKSSNGQDRGEQSPERLTRDAKPKGTHKIQSNPFISSIERN
jgi:hypothetical protein